MASALRPEVPTGVPSAPKLVDGERAGVLVSARGWPRAPAFSRYETYIFGSLWTTRRPPDWRRSSVHRCAAAWIEPRSTEGPYEMTRFRWSEALSRPLGPAPIR